MTKINRANRHVPHRLSVLDGESGLGTHSAGLGEPARYHRLVLSWPS